MVAEAALDPSTREETPPRRTHPAALVAVLVGASGAAAGWIGAAILAAGRGFDITDEGFYLLSYRWWSSIEWNFTGAQYLYGPLFQALHYDIAALRLVRLATIIVTHLLFGWAFMCWLRLRRPAAPPSRLWESAGVATIVAAGGMIYGWLPASPGYNDVVQLGALLIMAVVFRVGTRVDRGLSVPAWLPTAAGAIAFPMLLAKWSAVMVVGLLAATLALLLAGKPPGRARKTLRAAAWWVAGTVLAAALVHVFIVPLTSAVPRIVEVNRWIADGPYSLWGQLHHYGRTAAGSGLRTVTQHGLLIAAAVVAVVSRRRAVLRAAWALGVAAICVSIWRAVVAGGLTGGTVHVAQYVNVLLAAFGFVLIIAGLIVYRERSRRSPAGSGVSSPSRQHGRDWLVLGMLFVLPLAQAFGTSNAILTSGINAFAAWMAIVIALLTRMEAAPAVARRLATAVAAGAVLASACIAVGGLLLNPYRTARYAEATATVPGTAVTSGKIDQASAAKYGDLYARLRPWTEQPGRAVIAFDQMSGIVLLLGGRPVGEPWTSPADPRRTASGIKAECARGRPSWWGDRSPILLFNRSVTGTEVEALRACQLDFTTDYRLLLTTEYRRLAAPDLSVDLSVYVPTSSPGDVPR